jgi:hypothetical protein
MKKEQTVALLVQVPQSLRKRLRVAAAKRETTIAAVVIDALEALLQRVE